MRSFPFARTRARCFLVPILASLLLLIPAAGSASAAHRPDDHAPLGVMGDHVHHAGEFMLSFRSSFMGMRGNRDDGDRLSTSDVLADFPVTPTRMNMEMHMAGLMWAPSDRITLMAMVPYVRMDMDHETRMGGRFTTRSEGLGDISVSGLFSVFRNEQHRVQLNLGLGLPTGSISAEDDTPLGRTRLPYPMQIGSGTFDALPAVVYAGRADAWSWGGQLRAKIRLHRNRRDYRRGHEIGVTAWLARELLPWASASLRLDYLRFGDFEGADPGLNPMLIPTARPDLRGGQRLDLLLGLNTLVTGGPLAGHRFALEGGVPIFQRLDGPQLETDFRVVAGWQKAF